MLGHASVSITLDIYSPTGKEVAFSSIETNRVVGSKVEEHWVELDLLGLMQ